MITSNDWNDALDSWVDDERERLGGPPSPQEVAAYVSGELPPQEMARVRALLVYCPELTPLLTRRATRKPFALRLYAVAATVAIALLGFHAFEQQREITRPAVVSSQYELRATAMRSASLDQLPAGQPRYLITAILSAAPTERAYTLALTRGGRVLWSARNVQPVDGAFVLDVPGEFLTPGTYALDIRAGDRLIERYPFACVAPAR